MFLIGFMMCRKSGGSTYELKMDDAAIIGGPFGYPIELTNNIKLQVL